MAIAQIIEDFSNRVKTLSENQGRSRQAKSLKTRLLRIRTELETFNVDWDVSATVKVLDQYVAERTLQDQMSVELLQNALIVSDDLGWDWEQQQDVQNLLDAYEAAFASKHQEDNVTA